MEAILPIDLPKIDPIVVQCMFQYFSNMEALRLGQVPTGCLPRV